MRKQVPDTLKPAPAKPRRLEGHPTHEIRIIGGLWKRTRLKVADRPGLRPTPDRVRETLFNWLGQDLTGWRCLDAFAGTGVLGFEAASRGAVQVLMIEHDATLVTELMALKTRLGAATVTIVRGDGVMALKKATPGSLELVLLDPPFDSGLYEKALQAAAHAVTPGGFIYLEAPIAWTDELLLPFGLNVRRYVKAGAVHAHLLVRAP
jgi:16S rRNA (guanine966-N2)-methyltransferase